VLAQGLGISPGALVMRATSMSPLAPVLYPDCGIVRKIATTFLSSLRSPCSQPKNADGRHPAERASWASAHQRKRPTLPVPRRGSTSLRCRCWFNQRGLDHLMGCKSLTMKRLTINSAIHPRPLIAAHPISLRHLGDRQCVSKLRDNTQAWHGIQSFENKANQTHVRQRWNAREPMPPETLNLKTCPSRSSLFNVL